MQRPTAFLFLWERLQKSEHCTTESFTDGISTQIVWHGHRLLDVIHGVQLRNYGIFKNFGPCHCEYGLGYQYLGNGKCLLVVCNEGLTELGKCISQYQDVLLTIP